MTLLVPAVAWAASGVLLPGVEERKFALLAALPTTDLGSLSVVGLGLTPAIAAFVLVELAALIVPRWRALRLGGPEQRRPLRRASLVLAVLLASLQGWTMATYLQELQQLLPGGTPGESGGLGTRLLVTATLVAGSCFLLALVWLLERFGLGNGFSVLLASASCSRCCSTGSGGSSLCRAAETRTPLRSESWRPG